MNNPALPETLSRNSAENPSQGGLLPILSTLSIESPASPNSAGGVCRIYRGTLGIFQTPSENLPVVIWQFLFHARRMG